MNSENIVSIAQPAPHDGLDDLFVHVDVKQEESEKITSEPYSYWKSVLRVFIRKPATIIALSVLAILIAGTIIIPLFAPQDAFSSNMENANLAPSITHFFGTDVIGRDLWFLTWKGAGKSLILAVVESIMILLIGTIIGLIWGYFKKLDSLFVEIYNFISNIPSLLIYILLSIVFTYSLPSVPVEARLILSLTMLGWLELSLMIRNLVLIIDNREYNVASKTLATPASRIMFKNYLPYLLGVIITEFSLIIPGMISSEVAMSYFGVGLASKDVSLGAILELGIDKYSLYPWEILAPGLLLAIIIFAFFILGTTFSDALDPKKHR